MWCSAQFADFNDRLRLDSTRRDRITSAVETLKDFCEGDDELGAAMAEPPSLQGSVASRTAIRPLDSDDFDVDVVYSFGLYLLTTTEPKPILDWFARRLSEHDFYASNMVRKNRCVRIHYAGDFHMDVIPATSSLNRLQPYAVPARDLDKWIQTDPKGFRDWVAAKDAQSGNVDSNDDGSFVRAVRYSKRWRDHFFSDASSPSSILLVTLLGKHEASISQRYHPPLEYPLYSEYKHDAAYIFDLFRLTRSCLVNPPGNAFHHPTNSGENLAQGWAKNHLDVFLDLMGETIDQLREAILATDEEEAIANYRNALGDSFPAS